MKKTKKTQAQEKQYRNKTKTKTKEDKNKQTKQTCRVKLRYCPVIIHKEIEALEFVSELYGY